MSAADRDARGFLIVHGWQNHRPPGHWQHWLADQLSDEGAAVLYPQLPDPDRPSLTDWLAALRVQLALLSRAERVLICHSLAVLLWWTAASDLGDLAPDRIMLVAPPSPAFLRQQPDVAAFVPPRIETTPLPPDLRRRVRLLASDNDPYCPGGARAEYAQRHRLDADILPGAGHLDLDAGYGPWSSMLAWCHDPATRVTTRPAPR